jgi:hypothetical protein
MKKNISISEQQFITLIQSAIKENLEREEIDVSSERAVTMTDSHENLVDTSVVNNPTCTKDIIPSIEVWSLFKRKEGGVNDGNPLLYALKHEKNYQLTNPNFVYKRIEDLCDAFIRSHPNMDVTLAIPSTNSLNKFLYETLKRKCKGIMVIDNLMIKMTVEEVDDCIFEKTSLFRKTYGANYAQAHEAFETYCSKMKDGTFRLHLIKDMNMRKTIEHTIKLSDRFYGKYMEAINGKNILIVDDSVTNGQTITEAYKIIAECYEPKSITILTLMSPLYNKENKLKGIK